jgi:predicted ATPase
VYQRGLPPQSTYVFKHALIQDAAAQSLLKSTRQNYHQRIAQVLEAQFPEITATQPELLAHHYTEAGLTEQAVRYWYHAGQKAIERSAHVEAIVHLRQGLALLDTLPATPLHLQRELDMHIALGASLIATKGPAAPEVGQIYTRAQHLCAHLDDPHQLFPALRGLWNYSLIHGELQTAQALGEQLLSLAQHAHHPVMLVAARSALGSTLLYLGAVATAHLHFTQGMALYDPPQHHVYAFLSTYDTGVVCHSSAAWTFWLLGYPDQGLGRSQEAVTLAQQSGHPISLSFALSFAAVFHQFRREVCCTHERAAAAISLSQEQGFAQWMAMGAILHGWARVQQGHVKEGIAQLSDGLRALQATGAVIARPYDLALLAEAHGIQGEPEEGLALLTEALTLVDTTGERWYQSELYRLKGALLLQQSSSNQTEAESCFHQAIAVAQNQHAKSLELRAATSLARLWQQQGKRAEAHELLAPVYGWFTEGFDTADLQEAKALLDALA